MRKKIPGIAKGLWSVLKWLYPGVGWKRWFFLSVLGLTLAFIGATHSLASLRSISALDWFYLVIGLVLVVLGLWQVFSIFLGVLFPKKSRVVEILFERKILSKGPKIVVIGGGSGQSVLLHGLKEYTSNLTAIVTVADSGGSSGRLRTTFDMLPPGDIRNCLVALADVEPLVRDLFQYRFPKEIPELGGHSFGNLFLTVLSQITGDFEKAIKAASEVLAVRGCVFPSTFDKVSLVAEYVDGSTVKGEAEIPKVCKPIKRVFLEPQNPKACDEAIKAIYDADVILLGPGSLYTSIMPNLLVKGISDALKSTSAPKVYVCNVMTQKGETDNYTAVDHIRAIIEHTGMGAISHCIVNNTTIPQEALEKYAEEGAKEVPIGDLSSLKQFGVDVILSNVIDVVGVIRHNPHKIYNVLISTILSV